MSEQIRYAWGQSSLGEFIAAVSSKGLVAFEFMKQSGKVPASLRAHFPDTAIELDKWAADIVRKLSAIVDRPYFDPGIALDVRGSDYQKHVWNILRQIPAGQTTSYGAIAAEMGSPRDARDVTDAIANNTIALLIPCHRVVKKDGSLSGYRWGTRRKRALLAREEHLRDFKFVR
jgi:AraC family transcriptional regulator of adaptative response/methylated-DNA-[protein]-cysteine methyltransferase